MLAHRVIYHDQLAHLLWPRDKGRIVDDVILRKGRIWEREREVRYVSSTIIRNSIAFDGRAVSGLILGSRFPDKLKPTLRGLLDERSKQGLPPPKLYKAERRVDSYGVYLRRTTVD